MGSECGAEWELLWGQGQAGAVGTNVNRFSGSRAEPWRAPHVARTAQYSRMRSSCRNRSTEHSFRCFRQRSSTCVGMGGFGEHCAGPEQRLETVGVNKGGEA